MSAIVTLLALFVEAIFGYPQPVLQIVGHPVTWIGAMIAWLDRVLNHDAMSSLSRRLAGFIALGVTLFACGAVASVIEQRLLQLPFGVFVDAILASTLISQRSLHSHVKRVAVALETEGIAHARQAVSKIVGRDTDILDMTGVARAAIESLAENFSDGIVAPVFWLCLGGLAGGTIYKATNTADSMIGHRSSRYRDFGFAAAKFDDLVNLPASRLSALLIIAAAAMSGRASAVSAWRAFRRDARHHRSPNAGYPEAAMAGALGLALAGPRNYGGILVDDATMGDGRRAASAEDIRAALALYQRADAILLVLVATLVLALNLPPN